MDPYRRTLRWIRDAAIGATLLTVGILALGVITDQAYAGLPLVTANPRGASPEPESEQSPHGPQPVCASCHRGHTATETSLLLAASADSAVCVRCHNAEGEEAVSPHSNVDYAQATQPAFTVSCALCHDPHGDPDSGNKEMIRTNINGFAVNFARDEGEDSFDDGLNDGTHDSICVVCHSTTFHNNAFSSELIGEGHGPVGSDCMACHEHGNDPLQRAGFMPGLAPMAPVPADTAMPSPTDTPEPTPTATDTPAPQDTPTPEPTATAVPPPAPTPTPTPEPSATPPVPTQTPPP